MAEFSASGQLPLAVHLRADANLPDLYAEPNEGSIQWLSSIWAQREEQFCWLDAGAGAGLSHVMQALAQLGEQHAQTVFYLSFADNTQLSPDLLSELHIFDLLCLDDVDAVLGKSAWDRALLHCFNEMRAQHKQLVIGSHCSLSAIQSQALPDLWSRLNSGVVMHWQRPLQWARAVQHVALARGFILDDATCDYIALRAPRDWTQLMAILTKIDQATLVAKRRMTIPFIRQVMSW